MAETEITSSPKEYAGFWRRYLAYSVDNLLLLLIGLSLGVTVNINQNGGWIWFPSIVVSAAYFVFFWMKHDGQTLGNKLLAIRVVREDNKPMDAVTGIIRYIGYLISSLVFYLGFLWVVWDKKKQGWHDKIAKTVVLKTDAKPRYGLAILIVVVPLLLIMLIVAGIVSAGVLLFKNPVAQKAITESLGKYGPTMTQSSLDEIADRVTASLNTYRTKNQLSVFKEDKRLCAYAQRRVEQLNRAGKYDDGKGFYEDTANPQMVTAYFADYGKLNSGSYTLSLTSSSEDVLANWTSPPNNPFSERVYTHACIRAAGKFVVNVLGENKNPSAQ